MRIKLGHVGHFSVAVKDPSASAARWRKNFDLDGYRWELSVQNGAKRG